MTFDIVMVTICPRQYDIISNCLICKFQLIFDADICFLCRQLNIKWEKKGGNSKEIYRCVQTFSVLCRLLNINRDSNFPLITGFPLFLIRYYLVLFDFVCLMQFNATFNNISVISWRSVLLVEETARPGENHPPVASH